MLTTTVVMVLPDVPDQVYQDRESHARRSPGSGYGPCWWGVDVNRVISVTFIIGSATAAIGGVLIASHIGQINFYIGFIAGIKAFVAAVLGGIGSIPRSRAGKLWCSDGPNRFFTGYISSDYEDVFAFIFLVLILIFRPAGILGRSTTEKV